MYIATAREGILSYSIGTSEVDQVLSSCEIIFGIAYDSIYDKIYWSTDYKIYRGSRSIGEVEIVLSTSQCKSTFRYSSPLSSNRDQLSLYILNLLADSLFYNLDFDWIAGNLYVATWGGYILACDTNPTRPFRCATILTGRGNVVQITLNPNEGYVSEVR